MKWLFRLVFIATMVGAVHADETGFDEAQLAAAQGRYEDVVSILTSSLNSQQLSEEDTAIAYSNRGIAYSLLKRYGLAAQDLQQAIAMNPEHQLTLNHLGILAEHVEQNFGEAASWYEKAATLGYPASQVNLGNLYRNGKGVSRDPERAVQLYESAVSSDYDAAYVSLSAMYFQGQGVETNTRRGMELLQIGIDRGVITGHYYLGQAYENGWAVEQSYSQAATNYRLAAIEGHAPSQGALGYLYRRGSGVDKDFVEAAKWYRLAAEQGDAIAANRLAWLLATCPVDAVCSGTSALEFAMLAVSSNRSASNLDSMAAALARLGEFDEAISVIEEIVADDSIDSRTRSRYQSRLELYQHGIPFQL